MKISEFQQWARETDHRTQWDLLTTAQLLSHLMEEIGEVARALNRLYKYQEGESKEDQRLNLAHELVDAFWFLVKIANDSGEIENRSLVLQAGSFPGYAGDDPVG